MFRRLLGKKGRKYPIKRDERGMSARQRCFKLFEENMPSKDIAEAVGVPVSTVNKYYQQWQKDPNLQKQVAYLRQLLKKDSPEREKTIELMATAYHITNQEVEAIISQPNGAKRIVTGEFYFPRNKEDDYKRFVDFKLALLISDHLVNDGSKEHTRLDLDQFQSRVVRTVYDEILSGKGLTEVVKDLNSRGLPGPTGKGWGKTGLRKILGNESNTGTLVWGHNSKRGLPPVRVDSGCPAIVTREEFGRTQAILKGRSFAQAHPRRTSSAYLLSGVVRCGHCGKALVGGEAKSGRFSYYVCGSLLKKGAGACPSHYLNTKKLDGLVIEKIREHILTTENLSGLARLVTEELNNNVIEHQAEMQPLKAELADATRKLERLYDAVESGKIPLDDLAPRIREVKDRVDKLKARQAELELLIEGQRAEAASEEEVRECARDLRGLLERGSLTKRRSFIRSFVKNITITGDEARLTYTLPMLPRAGEEEAIPVLDIVHHGGPQCTIQRTFELSFKLKS